MLIYAPYCTIVTPPSRLPCAELTRLIQCTAGFTACWNAVLARINGAIEARRAAGEALPPPPKTAIAGPEYFGLTHPAILPQLEALDVDHVCVDYWAGKQVARSTC